MISVIGEEYIAFSETTKGQYAPLVAVAKYDGQIVFREIIRDDLLRIPDTQVSPGGWLFRKTLNSASSWIKRFCIVRGDFLLLFHSPQNEKPIGIIPLNDCRMVLPDGGEPSFDEEIGTFRANQGFEFDIRHTSQPTVRFYTTSEEEREDWVKLLKEHVGLAKLKQNGPAPVAGMGSNITITSTKLTGLSLDGHHNHSQNTQPNNEENAYNSYGQGGQNTYPYSPPALNGGAGGGAMPWQQAMSAPSHAAGARDRPPPYPQHAAPQGMSADQHMTASMNASQVAPYRPPPFGPPKDESRPKANRRQSTVVANNKGKIDFAKLERTLGNRLTEQHEARHRESVVRSKMASKEGLAEARKAEEANPLRLAELFRSALFFFDEELAEDPQPGAQQRIPHIKGEAVETMLLTVYQRYCSFSGFMTLEGFVEFMQDSAIAQTHAPHDENDDVDTEFQTLLDPVRLIKLVPRNDAVMAYDSYYSKLNEQLMQASKTDKFLISFSQFYQLLLIITEIVYSDLFAADPTVAFSKILQETICPLFVWVNGNNGATRHEKRGSTDVLVLEARILLLMSTYAPNLWRVFLTYAQDATGKLYEVNLSFPEAAQTNEKGLFRLPPAVPTRHAIPTKAAIPDSIFLTENGCLRFASDYGICPSLLTRKELREIWAGCNRPKTLISARLPSRDLALAATNKHERAMAKKNGKKEAPMHFGRGPNATELMAKEAAVLARQSKSPGRKGMADDDMSTLGDNRAESPPPPPPPTRSVQSAAAGGLGFSEFIEMLARLAVDALQQPSFHSLFPTPYSKVLALLSMWGVADLKRLEEVRTVHTEEIY